MNVPLVHHFLVLDKWYGAWTPAANAAAAEFLRRHKAEEELHVRFGAVRISEGITRSAIEYL